MNFDQFWFGDLVGSGVRAVHRPPITHCSTQIRENREVGLEISLMCRIR